MVQRAVLTVQQKEENWNCFANVLCF